MQCKRPPCLKFSFNFNEHSKVKILLHKQVTCKVCRTGAGETAAHIMTRPLVLARLWRACAHQAAVAFFACIRIKLHLNLLWSPDAISWHEPGLWLWIFHLFVHRFATQHISSCVKAENCCSVNFYFHICKMSSNASIVIMQFYA
jgi:hypothetical protein